MKDNKSQLDEMQEQKLLKIEHNGCWFAFWALIITCLVEEFILDFDFKAIAGEYIVFMILCVYLLIGCLKNGIWDRRLKADRKTNAFVSLIASAVLSALCSVNVYFRYEAPLLSVLLTFIFMFVFMFILLYVCLSLTAGIYKSKQNKLENAEEEDDIEEKIKVVQSTLEEDNSKDK